MRYYTYNITPESRIDFNISQGQIRSRCLGWPHVPAAIATWCECLTIEPKRMKIVNNVKTAVIAIVKWPKRDKLTNKVKVATVAGGSMWQLLWEGGWSKLIGSKQRRAWWNQKTKTTNMWSHWWKVKISRSSMRGSRKSQTSTIIRLCIKVKR